MDQSTVVGRRWKRLRINPVEYLASRNSAVPWIRFDPTVVKGADPNAIRRVRQSKHDGTVLFTHELITHVLADLVNRALHDVRDPPENHPDESPFYTVGWIRVATTFHLDGIDLPVGRYPGQRDRVSLAYRVYWKRDDWSGHVRWHSEAAGTPALPRS